MPTKKTLSLLVSSMVGAFVLSGQGAQANGDEADHSQWATLERYCFGCHNDEDWAGSLALNLLSAESVPENAESFEKVIKKLRGGLMPPPGEERPESQQLAETATWLEMTLDAHAAEQTPGRVGLRRLNRREYTYAIRDLLGLEIDAAKLLPADNLKHGFDVNAEALQTSPAFIDQYLNAARTIAHDAVGDTRPIPVMETYGSVADMIISLPARGQDGTGSQQHHVPGMPFGTRGGVSITHNFMADGVYELDIGDLALAREVPRLEFAHILIALLDGKEFYRTTIGGETDHKWIDQILDDAVAQINARLKKVRFEASAGQHTVSITFLQRSMAESDERVRSTVLEGGQARIPQINALQIRGPVEVYGISQSPSREKIFICYPREIAEETNCAKDILQDLATRAFRRPVTVEDMQPIISFYEGSRLRNDFEGSIRDAISAILVSPHFIYRAEDGNTNENGVYTLNDFELASRLSFFLWSSVPDEQLLELANAGKLKEDNVLRGELMRMLADPRADALIKDFSGQWLNLAKLDEINPNRFSFRFASGRLDPRPMFKEELNFFLDSILRSDESVVRLLDADYTFLNERLAMHYGIGDIKGSQMRRVYLEDPNRRGLLGKGAILMLTANPNRTAPVLRGAWILEHLLGTPPPEPPPNVEAFPENGAGPAKSVRERLAQHRANPSCFACHGVMDPLGLALENFNTVGQFRSVDPDNLQPIDTSGVLPDGTPINGASDLVDALLERKDMFVQTMVQNLLTYALGREVNYSDMPLVRKIARQTQSEGGSFSSMLYQVIISDAFRQREQLSQENKEQQSLPQQAAL
jgi:hypothetical protein